MAQLTSIVVALLLAQQGVTMSPNVIQSIGPKQDDPRGMCENNIEAIGPKQDDPRTAFNPETDPHASGGKEAIGPKQDDPRKGIIVQGGKALAIGPKQDDPRKGAVAVGAYNPETDPHAVSAAHCVKKKKD